jgi:hypothetical protein
MRLSYAFFVIVCWHFNSVESSVPVRGIKQDDPQGTRLILAHANAGESRPRGLSSQASGSAEIDWYDDDAIPNDDLALPVATRNSGFVHLGRAGKLQMTGMGGGKNTGMGNGMKNKGTPSKFSYPFGFWTMHANNSSRFHQKLQATLPSR